MIPKTLSASSILTYMNCPASWEAQYMQRMPAPNNSAAALGTACHEAMDRWVQDDHHKTHPQTKSWDALLGYYDEEYHTIFDNTDRYDEGKKMLQKWFKRQDFTEFTVISTEAKKHFMIPVTLPNGEPHEIRFNYIMDRVDKLANGEIRVVDYKTVAMPFGPDELRAKPQARLYGLAAQLEHKDKDRIKVVFDLLRHDEVGTAYTKADNRETRDWLFQMAQRIVNDDDPQEVLGEGCRFCPRKEVCGALTKHVANGGQLQPDATKVQIGRRLMEVDAAAQALKSHAESLQKQLTAAMEHDNIIELEEDGLVIKVGISGRRAIDAERIRQVIGDHKMAQWGNMRVGQVDEMLDNDPDLTDDQRSRVRQLFTKNYGDPKASVKLA